MSASRQKKLRQGQPAEAVEQKRLDKKEEDKAAKQLKVWTILFYVIIGLVVVFIVASAFINSGLLQRSLTAVTVGEHKLSAAEMNYFYGNAMNSDPYLSYMVKPGVPLDKQEMEEGKTFSDYLLENAITTARNMYAVYDEAVANGYTLTEEDKAAVDAAMAALDSTAAAYGYNSASALLRANYGVGCNTSNYRDFLEVQTVASNYATKYAEDLEYTPEEIKAESEKNPTDYSSYTYRVYTFATNDYYTTEAEEHTEEETEAAKAAAKAAADKMAADCKGDEKAFEAEVLKLNQAAADKKAAESEDKEAEKPEVKDTSLYENYPKANIASTMSEWIVDTARTAGETTVVEASNGYSVVMYVSSKDNADEKTVNVRHILISADNDEAKETAKAKIEEIKAEYEKNPTEENFAELANKYSTDPGSKTNGGLYEAVAPGMMVAEFDKWIFDGSRKAGDVDVVETDYGYHLMYFVGEGQYSYRDSLVVNALKNADYETWYNGLTEAVTTDNGIGYSFIKTDHVMQPKQPTR